VREERIETDGIPAKLYPGDATGLLLLGYGGGGSKDDEPCSVKGRCAPSHMTLMFGAPTVAAMPSIKAAVFGVGGIPVEARDKTAWMGSLASSSTRRCSCST
jgi:hypothetical protein